MVALLGDVDAGFVIFVLVVFLIAIFKGFHFAGGSTGTGESWESRCRWVYKNCLKDDFHKWMVEDAVEKYYRLNKHNREELLMHQDFVGCIKLQKQSFYNSDVMMVTGMLLEREKSARSRARNISRIIKRQSR